MQSAHPSASPEPRAGAKPGQFHGVLLLDKPKGMTSTACLNAIKRACGQKKIGHAGTLDPMATGLLVVMLGKATKMGPYVAGGEKVYTGALRLGVATDTFDITGQVVKEGDARSVTGEMVAEAMAAWEGEHMQEVPPYSAAKHKGKPLYALARAGKPVPAKEKEVSISQVRVLDMDLPEARFRVRCSAGTYVRSLVHSLGTRLGVGAALAELKREYSHPYSLAEARTLEEVVDDPQGLGDKIIPLSECLPHWPKVALDAEQAARVANGARLMARDTDWDPEPGQQAVFIAPDGRAVALVRAESTDRGVEWRILRGL